MQSRCQRPSRSTALLCMQPESGSAASAVCLQHLFPSLGVEPDERAYGGDCRLWIPQQGKVNWPVIKATVFDEFVIAHTVGW